MEQYPDDAPAVLTTGSLLVRRTDGTPHAYELSDAEGTPLGVVRRTDVERQAAILRKVTNWFEWTSSLPDVRLEVTDGGGAPLFTVVVSGDDARFTAVVRDPAGNDLGQLAKARRIGKIHFDLKAGGTTVGTVDAETWTGFDYRIDQGGVPVGRMALLGGDAVFGIPTTSDDVLLRLDRPLAEPLRTLVVACAVSLDVSVSSDG